MKILNVIAYWGHEYGGPFINAANLTASLMLKGHEVSVVTTARDLSGLGEACEWSVDGRPVSIPVRYFERGENFVCYSAGLERYLAQSIGQFDAVFIHGFWRYPLSRAAHHARKQEVPYWIFTHGMLSTWSLAQRRLQKALYLMASARTDIERAALILYMRQDELRLLAGLNQNNVLFKNALHLGDIKRAYADRQARLESENAQTVPPRINLLYLSRIHPKKGLDVLVKAMVGVIKRYPEVRLTIAGPVENSAFLERILARAEGDQIRSHIDLMGTVGGAVKENLLARSDIFVLPTEDDCMPLALLEAMASGMPVITTAGADIPAIDGRMGHVVKKTVEDVQNGIIRLIGSKASWRSTGTMGHEYVLKHFTWEERASEIEDILAGIQAVHG